MCKAVRRIRSIEGSYSKREVYADFLAPDVHHMLTFPFHEDLVNYTRFYVLARNPSVQSPSPCPNTSTRTALFRILNSAPKDSNRSQANIGTVINRLDSLQITRIDRRPSPGDVPFRDLYFLEVQSPEERIPSETEWKDLLRTFTENVRALGMDASLIGDW